MTIIQKIKDFLFQKTNTIETPEKYCPNCWGRQEYHGGFLKVIKNEIIDLNNIDQKKGWIDAYFVRHFEGIKLKKVESKLVCGVCDVSYLPL